jgi:hypothetical protein
MYTNNILGVI